MFWDNKEKTISICCIKDEGPSIMNHSKMTAIHTACGKNSTKILLSITFYKDRRGLKADQDV